MLHPRRHSDRREMPTKQKYHRMVLGVKGERGEGRLPVLSSPLPGKPLPELRLLSLLYYFVTDTTISP